MSKEIERKFLLPALPAFVADLTPYTIRQGYVAIEENGTEVRVRENSGRHFLTIKSGGTLERTEVEVVVQEREFLHLWPLTAGRRLQKNRYILREGSHRIEIDEFQGKLTGLILAEIEFPSLEDARNFEPPKWMGKEVTSDPAFKNQYLACQQSLPVIESVS